MTTPIHIAMARAENTASISDKVKFHNPNNYSEINVKKTENDFSEQIKKGLDLLPQQLLEHTTEDHVKKYIFQHIKKQYDECKITTPPSIDEALSTLKDEKIVFDKYPSFFDLNKKDFAAWRDKACESAHSFAINNLNLSEKKNHNQSLATLKTLKSNDTLSTKDIENAQKSLRIIEESTNTNIQKTLAADESILSAKKIPPLTQDERPNISNKLIKKINSNCAELLLLNKTMQNKYSSALLEKEYKQRKKMLAYNIKKLQLQLNELNSIKHGVAGYNAVLETIKPLNKHFNSTDILNNLKNSLNSGSNPEKISKIFSDDERSTYHYKKDNRGIWQKEYLRDKDGQKIKFNQAALHQALIDLKSSPTENKKYKYAKITKNSVGGIQEIQFKNEEAKMNFINEYYLPTLKSMQSISTNAQIEKVTTPPQPIWTKTPVPATPSTPSRKEDEDNREHQSFANK